MKVLLFEKSGIENLKYTDVKDEEPETHQVKIRVLSAGVNPIDYFVVNGIPVRPLPHIPGAEIYGEVEKTGDSVRNFSRGDKVVVYNRVFDGSCDMCLQSSENLCRNGGIISVITNGGYSEFFIVDEKNLIKVSGISEEIAASLPVAALTAYHGLRTAGLRAGETLVVFGASGNTGQFAVQLGKIMGAQVIAVSKKGWVKELGADLVTDLSNVKDVVSKVTEGKMADVVVDPLGEKTWLNSLEVVGVKGRWVTFGTLTGSNVSVQLNTIYSKHISLFGTTGGNRKELQELTSLSRKMKVKVGKVFSLEEGKEALKYLMAGDRDGRAIIKV
ncbi:alcohol dehydrogenase [Sulfolobales archaeon HS-7]|nr:alcohol dehydrogenase [Sulfolobales archaeon HS-7]